MEETKLRRKRVKRYPIQLNAYVSPEQMELIDKTAAEINQDRSATIREALKIGVVRLQKKHGRTHG